MAGHPTVSDAPAPSTNNPTSAETTPDTVSNATESSQPLPLPPPPASGDGVTQLDVSTGQAVKLDHLGPLVVNRDGTLSRIANWESMAEIERQNTLRVLGKRNQLRMESLKAQEEQGNQ